MSGNARWLDPAEPNKHLKRQKRHRPKSQIVAVVNVYERGAETDGETIASHFRITRTRLRSERYVKNNEDKEPGLDGCRWRCSCDQKGMRADHRAVAGDHFECAHLRAALTGDRVNEGELPRCTDKKMDYGHHLLDIPYVELTALGERLLRHRWSEYALRRTSEQ
jgi:hypothetical protein